MAVILKNADDSIVDGGGSDVGDIVALYNTKSENGSYDCLHRFCVGTSQTADVRFSRDGAHLIVWDNPITCQIQILQIAFGQRLVRYVR